jgi:hypothetical protein
LTNIIVLVVLVFFSSYSFAQTRLALLVGNNAYAEQPLVNAVADAQDVSRALSGLGFKVTELTNGTRESMFRAVEQFQSQIAPGDEVLFFYAGHAVQFNDRNYLLPVDVKVESEDDVAVSSLDLDDLLQGLSRTKAKSLIVILDACRDNPFGERVPIRQHGLSQPSVPPSTLIVYSTAPGEVANDGDGRNGMFTKHLLKHIATPGLSVEVMLKRVRNDVMADTSEAQVPWDSSTLRERFAFVPEDGADFSLTGMPTQLRARADSAFWSAANRSESILDIEEYLARFPSGAHADEARALLAKQYAKGQGEIDKAKGSLSLVRASGERWQFSVASLAKLAEQQRTLLGVFSTLIAGLSEDDRKLIEQVQKRMESKPYVSVMMGSFSQAGVVLIAHWSQSGYAMAVNTLNIECEYQRRGVGDVFPVPCFVLFSNGEWDIALIQKNLEKLVAVDPAFFFQEAKISLRKILRTLER